MDIDKLADHVRQKRAGNGVRKAAKEVDISSATLSRIENGKIPDLDTFAKICKWLGNDPINYLDIPSVTDSPPQARVHFKKETAIKPESAKALSEMILRANEALLNEHEIPE